MIARRPVPSVTARSSVLRSPVTIRGLGHGHLTGRPSPSRSTTTGGGGEHRRLLLGQHREDGEPVVVLRHEDGGVASMPMRCASGPSGPAAATRRRRRRGPSGRSSCIGQDVVAGHAVREAVACRQRSAGEVRGRLRREERRSWRLAPRRVPGQAGGHDRPATSASRSTSRRPAARRDRVHAAAPQARPGRACRSTRCCGAIGRGSTRSPTALRISVSSSAWRLLLRRGGRVEVTPHGAAADAEQGGDLLWREIGPVGQDEDRPGSHLEGIDRGPHLGRTSGSSTSIDRARASRCSRPTRRCRPRSSCRHSLAPLDAGRPAGS